MLKRRATNASEWSKQTVTSHGACLGWTTHTTNTGTVLSRIATVCVWLFSNEHYVLTVVWWDSLCWLWDASTLYLLFSLFVWVVNWIFVCVFSMMCRLRELTHSGTLDPTQVLGANDRDIINKKNLPILQRLWQQRSMSFEKKILFWCCERFWCLYCVLVQLTSCHRWVLSFFLCAMLCCQFLVFCLSNSNSICCDSSGVPCVLLGSEGLREEDFVRILPKIVSLSPSELEMMFQKMVCCFFALCRVVLCLPCVQCMPLSNMWSWFIFRFVSVCVLIINHVYSLYLLCMYVRMCHCLFLFLFDDAWVVNWIFLLCLCMCMCVINSQHKDADSDGSLTWDEFLSYLHRDVTHNWYFQSARGQYHLKALDIGFIFVSFCTYLTDWFYQFLGCGLVYDDYDSRVNDCLLSCGYVGSRFKMNEWNTCLLVFVMHSHSLIYFISPLLCLCFCFPHTCIAPITVSSAPVQQIVVIPASDPDSLSSTLNSGKYILRWCVLACLLASLFACIACLRACLIACLRACVHISMHISPCD